MSSLYCPNGAPYVSIAHRPFTITGNKALTSTATALLTSAMYTAVTISVVSGNVWVTIDGTTATATGATAYKLTSTSLPLDVLAKTISAISDATGATIQYLTKQSF